MTRNVTARLLRRSFMLISLGYAVGAVAGEASLLSSASDPRYRAVGRLNAQKICTGAVVAGSAEPEANRPALLLTAAHCVFEDIAANQVMVDGESPASWRFTPAYFQDSQAAHAPVSVERVLYATTKSVDLAVLQLNVTYGDLKASGVRPLVPAVAGVVGRLPVELVHAPWQDVPEADRFLRLSTCQAGEPSRLFEGEWFWTQESRTDCAGVSSGSSGSPVLRPGTLDIVGVLGTKVDAAFDGCGFNRPCELPGREPVSHAGATYHSLLAPMSAAFRADGGWEPAGLDRGDGVKLGRSVPQYTRSEVVEEGMAEPARWGVLVTDDTRWIRYKQGEAASVDCAQADGYGPPVLAREQPMDRLPVGRAEGAYVMCVIGQLDIDNDWQLPEHASVMLRIVDDTPPSVAPEVVIAQESDADVTLEVRGPYVSPYSIKAGALDRTDCAESTKYRVVALPFLKIPKAKAPFRLCARGADEAGNLSPVGFMDFPLSDAD